MKITGITVLGSDRQAILFAGCYRMLPHAERVDTVLEHLNTLVEPGISCSGSPA